MKDRSDDPSHHERPLLPRSYWFVRFTRDSDFTIVPLLRLVFALTVYDACACIDECNIAGRWGLNVYVCAYVCVRNGLFVFVLLCFVVGFLGG